MSGTAPSFSRKKIFFIYCVIESIHLIADEAQLIFCICTGANWHHNHLLVATGGVRMATAVLDSVSTPSPTPAKEVLNVSGSLAGNPGGGFCGWLEMRGTSGVVRQWKKRYVILKGTVLLF